jgi:hypothetical protein
MKFAIVISALGKNLYKISEWISKEIVNEVDEIIIIIQESKGFSREVNLLNSIGINCIISDDIGLSKSRNYGINASRSDFIWFLDDDVKTDINKIKIVKNNIINNKADIYTFRIALDDKGNLYKKYYNFKLFPKLSILKISSIEIVVSRLFINNNNILFDERFGLGSKYPKGEENIFILDCYKRKARIIHIPKIIVIHKLPISRIIQNNKMSLIAQGFIAKKYNFFGVFLIFRWYIRMLIKYSDIMSIKYLIKGFFIK